MEWYWPVKQLHMLLAYFSVSMFLSRLRWLAFLLAAVQVLLIFYLAVNKPL